jgi:hypothetical protein
MAHAPNTHFGCLELQGDTCHSYILLCICVYCCLLFPCHISTYNGENQKTRVWLIIPFIIQCLNKKIIATRGSVKTWTKWYIFALKNLYHVSTICRLIFWVFNQKLGAQGRMARILLYFVRDFSCKKTWL